jgi:hypothetical protein
MMMMLMSITDLFVDRLKERNKQAVVVIISTD